MISTFILIEDSVFKIIQKGKFSFVFEMVSNSSSSYLGSLMAGCRKKSSVNVYKHFHYCVCYRNGNYFKHSVTFDDLNLF